MDDETDFVAQCEAMIQFHFHTPPSEFKNMSEDEFIREYAKVKYIVDSQKQAYNNKINDK